MRILSLTLAAAMVAACGNKKTEPAPPKTVEPPPLPLQPTANRTLDCDSIIPKAARDKYFDGMQMELQKEKRGGSGRVLDCPLHKGKDLAYVQVMCNTLMNYSVNGILDTAKSELKDVKDVAGVGRRAYVGMRGDRQVLHFADDDTPCYGVLISVPHAEDVARIIVSNLTLALFK
jgi:hypothetical protein